jgi:peptidoglycan L-alanyl-D-glutamate endopeptidase CwlK
MYKFSKKSLLILSSCHADIIKIMVESIKLSRIDFCIIEGKRSIEKQQKYFAEGKSKIDGVTARSKHQGYPTDDDVSFAVDICAVKNSYDVKALCFLADVIILTAKKLYADKIITHELRWGGNWDGDGEIMTDQTFIDLPHFELIV